VGIWGEEWKSSEIKMFQTPEINNLLVIWRNNKKSLDDCSCNGRVVKHVSCKNEEGKLKEMPFFFLTMLPATLSNVKIAWFPANATSVLQPMDMVLLTHPNCTTDNFRCSL
jgi:hypothetical protein